MSVRLGVDIQPVGEIETSLALFGERYLTSVYTGGECTHARAHPQTAAAYLAGRFAAREAILKLLEVSDALAIWKDITLGAPTCSPVVSLRGYALDLAKTRGVYRISLSISVRRDKATAVAIADYSVG